MVNFIVWLLIMWFLIGGLGLPWIVGLVGATILILPSFLLSPLFRERTHEVHHHRTIINRNQVDRRSVNTYHDKVLNYYAERDDEEEEDKYLN